MPNVGRFYVSNVGDNGDSIPDELCLDQNICTYIYGFYYGLSNDHREDVKALLLAYPFSPYKSRTHISCGWAVEEYSWERTGEYKDVDKRKYDWAVKQVLNWDPERVEFEFSQRRPPCDRDRVWNRSKIPIPEKTIHPLSYLIMHYPPMLRLASLIKEAHRRGGKQGREWAFKQFAAWMTDELGYNNAYELAVAKDSLLPRDNSIRTAAQKVLHLSPTETPDTLAGKAWRAAWDMFYVRYVDPSGLGNLISKRKNIALVSRDTDTPDVNSRAHLVDIMGDLSIFRMESDFELPESEHVTDVGYGVQIYGRARPRSSKFAPYEALDDLERSLGVQRRTISAFLECPGPLDPATRDLLETLDRRT